MLDLDADPDGGLTHLFPDPATLAQLDPATLVMPGARRRTLVGALATGSSISVRPATGRRPGTGWTRCPASGP